MLNEFDTIRCNALVYDCRLGFHKSEQTKNQRIKVDFEAFVSRCANKEDCVSAIQLDYYKANELIEKHLKNKKYNLIETVCEDIANLILKNFEVKQVMVSVSKYPDTMPNMESVTYTCMRKRP